MFSIRERIENTVFLGERRVNPGPSYGVVIHGISRRFSYFSLFRRARTNVTTTIEMVIKERPGITLPRTRIEYPLAWSGAV